MKEAVKSPTYNLYTIYHGNRQLDAYRIDSLTALDYLMIEDFLCSPWRLAITWPEKIKESIPKDTWHLHLSIISETKHCIQQH